MNILGCGTGVSTLTNGLPELKGSTLYHSAYVQESILTSKNLGLTAISLDLNASSTDIICMSGYIYPKAQGSASYQINPTNNVIAFYHEGAIRLLIRAGDCIIFNESNVSTNLGSTSLNNIGFGTLTRVDVKIDFSVTEGSIEVYLNGGISSSHDADLSAYWGTTRPDQIRIGALSNYNTDAWSAVFAADELTTGIVMSQHLPISNGSYAEMTGEYSDINTLTTQGLDGSVFPTALGQTSTFNCEPTLESLEGTIPVGVAIVTKTMKGYVETLYHTSYDGSVSVNGDKLVMSSEAKVQMSYFPTAPDGSEWTTLSFSSCQFGLKS